MLSDKESDTIIAKATISSPKTAQKQLFAELLNNGYNQLQAFRKAFPASRMKDNGASVAAHRLTKDQTVIDRLTKLRSGELSVQPVLSGCLDRDHKRSILSTLIADAGTEPMVRLRAIEIDNRMAGHEAPRATVTLSPSLAIADSILQRFASQGDKRANPEPVEAKAIELPAIGDPPPPPIGPPP